MLPAGPHHGIGHGVEIRLQAKAQGAHAGLDQALHVGVHRLLAAALAHERQAGREQELAVEQVGGGVFQLARLHPAQALLAVAAVVHDGQCRQLAQELRQRDEAEPLRVLSSHGRGPRAGRPAGGSKCIKSHE